MAQVCQQLMQHLSIAAQMVYQHLYGESSLGRVHVDANGAEPLTSDFLGETSGLVPVCCGGGVSGGS